MISFPSASNQHAARNPVSHHFCSLNRPSLAVTPFVVLSQRAHCCLSPSLPWSIRSGCSQIWQVESVASSVCWSHLTACKICCKELVAFLVISQVKQKGLYSQDKLVDSKLIFCDCFCFFAQFLTKDLPRNYAYYCCFG